jgi:uncharacterized membrane protein YedE/YeeE
MPITQIIPLLLGVLVGVLLSVVAWSFLSTRRHALGDDGVDIQDQVLLWLLILAVFGAGVFVTYVLLRL